MPFGTRACNWRENREYSLHVCYTTSVLVAQHPRRPRGSQLSREKRRDESFQAQVEEPLGTDSHRTISKRSSECWLLIGHKKCFVLLCPIGEQFLVSSYTIGIMSPQLPGSFTKLVRTRETSIFYFPNQKRRNYR